MKLFGSRTPRPLRVAILGSGPAGLFAAQAAHDASSVVSIFSRGQKSSLYGAQYLHAPIPGLDCGKGELIQYILKGTVEDYRLKVYGEWDSDIRVSPEALSPTHTAWNIRSAYDDAWERFKGLITEVEIKPDWLRRGFEAFDLVIWTLPLMSFCVGGHMFKTQDVWAQGDAPDMQRYCSVTVDPWTVVVNAEETPRWYRAANVFGHRTAEWPERIKPPVSGVVKVSKPVDTNCLCWNNHMMMAPVIRVGRYGTWTKGELSHQAYGHTRAAIEKLG